VKNCEVSEVWWIFNDHFILHLESPFIWQWAAANCAALPTANAGQYAASAVLVSL